MDGPTQDVETPAEFVARWRTAGTALAALRRAELAELLELKGDPSALERLESMREHRHSG